MKISVLIISILLSVICVLTALLQYYYMNYRRLIFEKYHIPAFDELIPSGDNQKALGYFYNEWDNEGGGNLLVLLKSNIESYLYPSETKTEGLFAKQNDQVSDNEVHHTLQAALSFKLLGKVEKAKKLFEHAAAMAPQNPDVLNHYGEFLENKDIVSADELYCRALAYSPDHKSALLNRKRTAPVVDLIDANTFKAIDEKRDLLKNKLDVDSFETIKREAYYLHIFHTVGIEGNTLSLQEMRYLLETKKAIADKSILEHNEVLGLELAIHYVKLLTRIGMIGIKEILGIHRRVMGHVDPLTSGIFRNQQVFVGSHVPPLPEEVPALMREYVDWLHSEETENMHPVRFAALAHLKLVDIHPFSDGNGRTSRLIMNLILLRAGYPPVIILKQHRKQYHQYLDIAHKGDVRPFVRFIAQCTDEVLKMYIEGAEQVTMIAGSDDKRRVIEMNEVIEKS